MVNFKKAFGYFSYGVGFTTLIHFSITDVSGIDPLISFAVLGIGSIFLSTSS